MEQLKQPNYNCFFPQRIMDALQDKAQIKIMFIVLKECRKAHRLNNIRIDISDFTGLSRPSIYKALKSLESIWIHVERPTCHSLVISLLENYYEPWELAGITGKGSIK